jgi:hypothetical protein
MQWRRAHAVGSRRKRLTFGWHECRRSQVQCANLVKQISSRLVKIYKQLTVYHAAHEDAYERPTVDDKVGVGLFHMRRR